MQTKERIRTSIIENLEARIAPASASVSYIDLDGDVVKITANKPGATAPPLDADDLVFTDGNPDGQLKTLTLTDAGFEGASLTFKVTRKSGGDGLAHVGFIDATGVDLNKVTVKGDLGKIVAGDVTTADDPGLHLLQVRSMGTFGITTQGNSGDLLSTINGALGSLKIAQDLTDAFLQTTGAADGEIGAVFIGGDLTGGAQTSSGQIKASGAIDRVSVGGNLTGGAGDDSGRIVSTVSIDDLRIGGNLNGGSGVRSGLIGAGGALGDVRVRGNITGAGGEQSGRIASNSEIGDIYIGGSLIGGAGNFSGEISSGGAIGDVRIGDDVIGGAGGRSGEIFNIGSMGEVRIGGNLIGGSASASGRLYSGKSIGHVFLGGDLVGGSIAGSTSLFASGMIQSIGSIAGVTTKGSLIAGTDDSTGTLTLSGVIAAGDDLGPVKIGGSIVGNSNNPARIIAKGQDLKSATDIDTAIASVTVGGDVRFAQILAGFELSSEGALLPANADASIGSIQVGSDWVASDVVAGAMDAGVAGYGNGDALQASTNTALIALIASITIKGDVSGSLIVGDHFGFVAEQIEKLRIGTLTFDLTEGPSNDIAVPFHLTDDMRLLEVN